jgi:hypothetical protein
VADAFFLSSKTMPFIKSIHYNMWGEFAIEQLFNGDYKFSQGDRVCYVRESDLYHIEFL